MKRNKNKREMSTIVRELKNITKNIDLHEFSHEIRVILRQTIEFVKNLDDNGFSKKDNNGNQ